MKKKLLITALIVALTGSMSELYAIHETKKTAHAPILEDDDDDMDLDVMQMMASIKPKKLTVFQQKMSLWGSWLVISYINWLQYFKAQLPSINNPAKKKFRRKKS